MQTLEKTTHWAGILALLYQNTILKILMVRNHDGTWGIPGGRANADESPEMTAVRETNEETKLLLLPKNLIKSQEFDFTKMPTFVFYTFIKEYKGRQIKDDDDTAEARLFTILEARRLDLKNRDKIIIEQLSSIASPGTIEKMYTEFLIAA
ncbi:MAG: hypothetical protein RL641_210 [Candidatus Parcubacteria bacterium]|jgi:ADP-ribose pyrophosphatase YjhB (NUDIX family)